MRGLAPVGLLLASACSQPQAPPPQTADTEPPRIAVALRLEDAPEGASGAAVDMPASKASLVLIRESGEREAHDLGIYLGACAPRPPGDGELVRVECWWAGSGAHLVALRGERDIVVTSTPIDEMTGAGHPQERARIPLEPPDAELDPITP